MGGRADTQHSTDIVNTADVPDGSAEGSDCGSVAAANDAARYDRAAFDAKHSNVAEHLSVDNTGYTEHFSRDDFAVHFSGHDEQSVIVFG